ncbi:hypothetical protein [Kamptonema sp. UHCC 0994]|uniref:hypothetical protein n=1 Tax=Kamptonema sp. UHCC 0994 TaxID=3031329 RepID=UPI0023BA137D|nr:hypothetical protein [Kamptonema sp. UHCC 0994]MDF0554156.1 hypothetical protein [Kamptonema sp. UHCC 0994]
MRNFWVWMLLLSSAILTWDLIGWKSAIAATSNANIQHTNPPLQVAETQPNISDLVTPTDSAYAALQVIVERYGCIPPDFYYRCQGRCSPNMTRIEFAEVINSCTELFNMLIAEGKIDLVHKEDIATMKRLEQEFATELATLRERNR